MSLEQQIISVEVTESDGKYKSTKDCIQSLMPYKIRKVSNKKRTSQKRILIRSPEPGRPERSQHYMLVP